MKVIQKIFAALILVTAAGALQAEDAHLADRYFDLYMHQKIESLAPMMADEIHFKDSANQWSGKSNVLAGLQQVFSSILMGRFEEERRYTSGQDAVYDGTVSFKMRGAALGHAGKEFEFTVAFIVALTIENGKVTRHIDYVDNLAFRDQLQAQLAKN